MEDPQQLQQSADDDVLKRILRAPQLGALESKAAGELPRLGKAVAQQDDLILQKILAHPPTARDEAIMRDVPGTSLAQARKFAQSDAAAKVSHLPPAVPTRAAPVDQIAAQYEVLKKGGFVGLTNVDLENFTAPLKAAHWEVGPDYIKPPPGTEKNYPLWQYQLRGQQAQAQPPDTRAPITRVFARGGQAVAEAAKGFAEPAVESVAGTLRGDPFAQPKAAYKAFLKPQWDQLTQGWDAYQRDQQDPNLGPGMISHEAVGHFLAGITPFFGPMAASGSEKVGKGVGKLTVGDVRGWGDIIDATPEIVMLAAPLAAKAFAAIDKGVPAETAMSDIAGQLRPLLEKRLKEQVPAGETVATGITMGRAEPMIPPSEPTPTALATVINVRAPGSGRLRGQMGVVRIEPDGTATFERMIRAGTKGEPRPPADLRIPMDEFEGLFPDKPEGFAPGVLEANRQQFIKDAAPLIKRMQPKEVPSAETVRGDQGQLRQGGQAVEGGQTPSGPDIYRQGQGRVAPQSGSEPARGQAAAQQTEVTNVNQEPATQVLRPDAAAGAEEAAQQGQVAAPGATGQAAGAQGERSLPKTLAKAGLEPGSDLTYDVAHHADTIEAAARNIAEKGVAGAAEYARSAEAPTAEHAATAWQAIRAMQDAGDFAGAGQLATDMSVNMTNAGGYINAAKLMGEFDPARAVVTGARIVEQTTGGKKVLGPIRTERITKAAQAISEAEKVAVAADAKVDAVAAKLPAESPANWRAKLTAAEDAARQRLAERKAAMEAGTLKEFGSGGLSTEELLDYATIGAAKLARKGIDFATWSKEMATEFGDSIKPHLANIYRASFERYSDTKRAAYQAMKERAVRRALPNATADELAAAVKERDAAIKAKAAATRGLAIEYQRLQPLSMALRNISAIRKAGMLTSPKTWARNITGNEAMQILDELGRAPAAIADTAMSLGTGQRSISGPNPIALIDATLQGIRKGGKQGLEIMQHGATQEQMQKLQFGSEVNTGIKVVDVATNAVFRFMGAQDRVFYEASYARNLADRARIAAKNEGAANVGARAAEIKANPPTEMRAAAEHDALVATFNNNNALSDAIQRGRSRLGPAGNFALDLVLPFDRTPTNIVARILEASPLGYGKNAVQIARSVINGSLSIEEQRAIAQTFGRATVGSGLMLLGWKLAAKGKLTGPYSEDRQVNAERKVAGTPPMSLQTPAGPIEIGRLSPVGNLLVLGAGMYEETHRKGGSPARIALGAAMEQPLLRATSQVSEAIANPEKRGVSFAANLAGSFVPASAAVRDIARATDKAATRYPTTFGQRVEQNLPVLRRKVPALPTDKRMDTMSFAELAAVYKDARPQDRVKIAERLDAKFGHALSRAQNELGYNRLLRLYEQATGHPPR